MITFAYTLSAVLIVSAVGVVLFATRPMLIWMFMFAVSYPYRRRVLRNTECVKFRPRKDFVFNELLYWKSAALIQSRCAESRHFSQCLACQQPDDCRGDYVSRQQCSASHYRHDNSADLAADLLGRIAVHWRHRDMRTIYRALSTADTMEDVNTILSPNEEIDLSAAKVVESPQSSTTPPDPDTSAFLQRCRELTKKEYSDLPFAVKWEFAQQNTARENAEMQVA